MNERQDAWDDWLPMAEFTYNNNVHSSTQQTPFFIDTEWVLNLCNSPLKLKQYWNLQIAWRTPLAKHMQHLQSPRMIAGNKVFLDASDIHTTHPSKLSHCFLGPFVVIQPTRLHAYCLWLPPSMLHIHPVFHVVKLTPALEDLIRWWVQCPLWLGVNSTTRWSLSWIAGWRLEGWSSQSARRFMGMRKTHGWVYHDWFCSSIAITQVHLVTFVQFTLTAWTSKLVYPSQVSNAIRYCFKDEIWKWSSK